MIRRFHLYGDNVVECERIVDLFSKALNLKNLKRRGSLTNLLVYGNLKKQSFEFVFFPGFGRWKQDVLEYIELRGGVLREAADCIVTEVIGQKENVIVAIEFCSALPAGNQAWQRSGRAYSFAKVRIPYIYLTEIGGYELNGDRKKKAPRMPNPALPFSYLTYSNLMDTQVLIIYQFDPGADKKNKDKYKDAIGSENLLDFLRAIIFGSKLDGIQSSIEKKALQFIKILASNNNSTKKKFTPENWEQLYDKTQTKGDCIDALVDIRKIEWKKKVSIKTITDSAKKLMLLGSKYSYGLTSKDLPMCFIPKSKSNLFFKELLKIHPSISDNIMQMFAGSNHVAICWICGFKPRGDDSRPDRGLLPFLRMLIGESIPVLTVVYGPAKQSTWKLLETNPRQLAQKNGLWQAIFGLSDGLIIDSSTLKKNPISMHKKDWDEKIVNKNSIEYMQYNSSIKPIQFGENDVDSALHIILKHMIGLECFESMCNPPGGDWSGISIINKEKEYRWLSLPRVSKSGSKRPDHVIQFLKTNQIFCIESKNYLVNLESGIGPRLIQYCSELLSYPPSCKRLVQPDLGQWDDNVDQYIDPGFKYLSAAAYINKGNTTLDDGLEKSKCDIVFTFDFSHDNLTIVEVKHRNDNATEFVNLLKKMNIPKDIQLKLNFHS